MSLAGKRIAAYARFSTDKQSAQSTTDQHAKIDRAVAARGGEVSPHLRFDDAAVSGAVRDRPGLSMLMRAVALGDVDVLVVEDLSRLSRDTEDLAGIRKRLTYADVRLIAVDGHDSDAEGSELMGDVLGAFAAQYRRDIGKKTLRGMEGRARAGMTSGALPIGYASIALPAGGFKIEIDPVGAETVRSIFAAYAKGISLADLAASLNARGIEAPRRGRNEWQASTVRAILHNEKYAGTWSFGTTVWSRDPETRRRRPKKRSTPLVVQQRPDLAIVDSAVWAAVLARFGESRTVYNGRARTPAGQRMTYPLSGVLRCGVCRSLMSIVGGEINRRYYRCSSARRGALRCTQAEHIPEKALRAAVIATIRDRFASPANVDRLRAIIAEEIAAANVVHDDRRELVQRLERSEAKLRRLVAAIADGDAPAALMAAVRDEETQANAVRAEIDRACARPAVALRVPDAAEVVAFLDVALSGPAAEVRTALRGMLQGGEMLVERAGEGRFTVKGALLLSCIAGAQSSREQTGVALPFLADFSVRREAA